jgi:hypothetical protein
MATLPTRDTAGAGSVPLPPGDVYTPADLSRCWKLCQNTIRKLFQDAVGVFRLGDGHPRGKRSYQTLRIPRAVAERVWRERSR